MSNDSEQLAIEVIAKIGALEKQMAKAAGVTARAYREMSLSSRKATSQMENEAIRSSLRINQAMSQVGQRVGDFGKAFAVGFISTAALKSAQELIDAATRIENALKVAGLSGENLRAVYDQLFQSAQQNAAPLESLVTLYGRLSLVQKELGVTQDELIGFSNNVALALRVGGQSAEASSGALLQLSQALGGGIVRAEEFNSVLEGAPTIAQAVAAGLKEAGGSVSRLRNLVVDGKVSSEAFFRAFEAGAVTLEAKVASSTMTVSQQFVRLQNVMIDAAGKIDIATGASARLGGGLQELAATVQSFGAIIVEVAESDVGAFIGKIADAYGQVSGLIKLLGGLPGVIAKVSAANADLFNGRELGAGMSEKAIQGRIEQAFDSPAAPKTVRLPAAATTAVKPVSLEDYAVPVTPKTGGGRSGSKGGGATSADELAREIAALKERTIALNANTAAQAGLNPLVDDFGFAVEKAKARQDLLTAAQQAGKAITPELSASIDKLAEGYANASVAAEQLAASQDAIKDQARDFASAAQNTTKSFIDDLRNGASAADALGNALGRVADTIIDQLVTSIFSVNKAGGGGLFGSIFSSLGSLFSLPGNSKGTDSWSGGPTWVGEKGPEVVNLPKGSQVIPNHELRQMPADRQSATPAVQRQKVDVATHVTVGVAADGNGNLMPFVKDVAQKESRKTTSKGLRDFNAKLPDRMQEIDRNPRKRTR